eukprot:5688516-Pleurochrysis_carterae.AAC.2
MAEGGVATAKVRVWWMRNRTALMEQEVKAASSALSCSFASAMLREFRRCSSSSNSGVRVA